MDKSSIKELLIQLKNSGIYETPKRVMSSRRAYIILKRRAEREGRGELFDNFYLIREAYSAIRRKSITKRMRAVTALLFPHVLPDGLSDALSALFEVFSSELSGEETERVREAMLAESLRATVNNRPDAISIIRKLLIFDMTPFELGYSVSEQLLRRDPTGLWTKLDRETKELYRKRITQYSKKRGLSFNQGCERLLNEASEKKCHIGELLPTEKKRSGWLVLPASIFVLLILILVYVLNGAFSLSGTVLMTLLAVLPLWQSAFELSVPIIARFEKSEILPRLDMSKIPEECAVLSVVTALGTNADEVKKLFSHLEMLSLKTRSRGKDEYAFWGVLLDLKESNSEKDSSDSKIIRTAKSEIGRLNGLYGEKFVLFTRQREWNEKNKKYIPHERKRGAIEELVKLLRNKPSTLEICGSIPCTIKYVLTLDSDTDMELGALNTMLGTMAHPQNKAVISQRNGVNVVTKGYGILQPALVSTIESVHKTRFSTLMSGSGGADVYHASIFNLNHVLFSEGIFCGKGLFDVEAFEKTVIGAFPDNCVLSHDMLEGTRLRTGYISDVIFFDSVPSSARSYYNRAHRWARGDVQNLRFIKRRVRTQNGTVRNPMLSSQKFAFVMNVLQLVVPICQTVGLFAVMRFGIERLTLVSFFFLLPIFAPLFNEVFSSSLRGSVFNILRRFFSDTLTSICREVLMLGYRLSSLVFVAYKNADATIRALWRMNVSGEKLLEWTTASQAERCENSIRSLFKYTAVSFGAGVFMLVFSRLALCKLLGILWCLFFVILYTLSKSNRQFEISPSKKRIIKRWARDIWRYFEKYVDSAGNYLPPDNVSVFPSSDIAFRTSPTNIGLYLLSVLAALDFSFIDLNEAVERIENTVTTIEKLPKFRGQLYNWYSTPSLEVIGQEYVSTVDCSNFVTSLVALYQGLLPYAKNDKRVASLCQRIKKIETDSDFRFLFDSSRNLFSLGYFTDEDKRDSIVYDMYMSEMRTGDYYAVACGTVRASHWSALSRPLVCSLKGVGTLSWSGTAFEYFMPHLLLPVYKNSFAHETLSFAFSEQEAFGAHVGRERIFGISESGYFAFDESLGYQYRAFGIPSLSRRTDSGSQKVISPYSSFLMLRVQPNTVIKNLEALERIGMYGECGFYEAIDLTQARVGNRASAVKSFMSHHLGMSMVAAANAVYDDIFVGRFMSDTRMSAVSELLKERVPQNAVGIKKDVISKSSVLPSAKRRITENKATRLNTQASMWALTGRESSALLFERGLISLDIPSGRGGTLSAFRPLSVTHNPCLFIFSRVGDKVYSPSVSQDVSYRYDFGNVSYRQGELYATVSLSPRTCALRIRLEASGEFGETGLYFEPVLKALDSYMSHPAFSGLFFKSEYSDGALIMTATGENPSSLAVVSNSPFTFETSREILFDSIEFSLSELLSAVGKPLSSAVGVPVSPCVLVKSRFEKRTDTTFVIGFGKTRSEALSNAREELGTPLSRSIKRSNDLFYSALSASGWAEGFDRGVFSQMLNTMRPHSTLVLSDEKPDVYSKNAVYSLGISGSFPVFYVKSDIPSDELRALLLCHKLHYIMGQRYELVIGVSDNGYSRGGRGELEGMIESSGCAFLLGKGGGIHFADISSLPEKMLYSLSAASYPFEKRVEKYPYRQYAHFPIESNDEDRVGYSIDLHGEKPSVQWSHIIASQTFGTMLSHRSLGNTWVYNSRLSRVTYWENDNVGGHFSEKVIYEKDGVSTDMCASSGRVVFSDGCAEYFGRYFNIRVAIHPTLMFKAVSVTVEDEDFSLFYKMIPILDDFPHASGRVEYFSDSKNSVIFRNLFSESLTRGFGYLMMPFEKEISLGSDGFGVHCTRGGEAVFVLGYAGSEKHYDYVKHYFSTHRFSDVLSLSRNSLSHLVNSPVSNREHWLAYQTVVSRFFARSGPYQSGGAWGFRDQAQDCLSLLDTAPDIVRAHIARMASHQFLEGDVQHWWHSRRGVRTLCSDDYLWLVWLTCVYIIRTGDRSVLDIPVRYLVSKPLGTSERERYEIPDVSEVREPLSQHLKRALDLLVQRGLGAHGVPYILGGDWNDGMNMLPSGSESVWLGFFARIVIHLYNKTVENNKEYTVFSQKIREGLENSFFSDRYARAFLPDGEVLGVRGSRYFAIDALPQAFASLCHAVIGDGNVSRITLALDSAWRELYDEKRGIYKLFSTPFSSYDSKIGYITAYPEGVRENGGQYTHAAVWAGFGFLYAPDKRVENRKRAETLCRVLDPFEKNSSVYKTEPYVLCGDVYSNGHGGWSWYTGSASWYRDFILRISDKNRNKRTPLT